VLGVGAACLELAAMTPFLYLLEARDLIWDLLDALCGSRVTTNYIRIGGISADLPEGFARVRIPAQRYAVFAHRGHISTIRSTVYTIWNKWVPESGHQVADAPNFERYDPALFDPRTGNGVVEIWVPLKT